MHKSSTAFHSIVLLILSALAEIDISYKFLHIKDFFQMHYQDLQTQTVPKTTD